MTPTLAIVLTPLGPVMGTLSDTEAGFELAKPRAIQLAPQGGGQVQVGFFDLVGNPEILYLPGEITYYRPTARNILDTYLQAVSGITLATAMPKLARVQ